MLTLLGSGQGQNGGGGAIPSFALNFATISDDFTFTRSSFATRVNEFGLIETVTDLGSELVTNGTFDTDSDWDKLNSTISNGKGNLDGTGVTSFLYQGVLTDTKTYQATFTVSNYNGLGSARAINNNGSLLYQIISNGTFTFTFTHSIANSNFIFSATTGAIFSIDNVSVQEVLEDDVPRIDYSDATFDVPVYGNELLTDGVISNVNGGIMTFTANGVNAVSDGTTGSTLRPRLLWNSLTVGKQYRIIGTPTVNSGTTNYAIYNGSSYEKNNVAVESFDITFTCGGSNVFFTNDGTQTFDIDWDLSIKEVTAYTTTDKGAFLLEPQSTNLITYSEDFSQWNLQGNTLNLVSGVAPDGNTSVYELTSVSSGKMQWLISGLSVNTEYTFSFYVKQTSSTTLVQSRVLSLTGGSGGSNLIEVNYEDQLVTDEWVRITHTFTTNDTLGNYIVYVSNALTVGESLQFWGAQVEELPYATSYIPTNGSTVTRAQETCVDATPTINSEEGVLYAEISALANEGGFRLMSLSDGTQNNTVYIGYDGTSANRLTSAVRVSTSYEFLETHNISDSTDIIKVALKYKENDFAFWVNGVKVDTDLVGSVFSANTLTKLSFNRGGGSLPFYGNTKDLRIYDKALTDEELTLLTSL